MGNIQKNTETKMRLVGLININRKERQNTPPFMKVVYLVNHHSCTANPTKMAMRNKWRTSLLCKNQWTAARLVQFQQLLKTRMIFKILNFTRLHTYTNKYPEAEAVPKKSLTKTEINFLLKKITWFWKHRRITTLMPLDFIFFSMGRRRQ